MSRLDYSQEPWIRTYTRDTGGWLDLPVLTRMVYLLISRAFDRRGRIRLGKDRITTLRRITHWDERDLDLSPQVDALIAGGWFAVGEADDGEPILYDPEWAEAQGPRTSAARSKRSGLNLSAEQIAAADSVWAKVNQIRKEGIPGSRSLALTDERRARIVKLLERHGEETMLAAARSFARDPNSQAWFNGETFLVEKNLLRAAERHNPDDDLVFDSRGNRVRRSEVMR